MLLWKNGMIIQKGYITILVEKIKDYQGKQQDMKQIPSANCSYPDVAAGGTLKYF